LRPPRDPQPASIRDCVDWTLRKIRDGAERGAKEGKAARGREALQQPINRLGDVAPRVHREHVAVLGSDLRLLLDIMPSIGSAMLDQILRDLFEDGCVVTVQGRVIYHAG